MRILLFFAFLLAINFAQGQTDDNRRSDSQIIYGSHVDFGFWTILGKSFKLVVAPRTFKENWPLYGYDMSSSYLTENRCNKLRSDYSEISIALKKTYGSTESYIGLPPSSTAVAQFSDSVENFCGWLNDPERIEQTMFKLDTVPLDLPSGVIERIGHTDLDLRPIMEGDIIDLDVTQSASILTWINEQGTNQAIAWKWSDSIDQNTDTLWQYTPTENDDQSSLNVQYYFSLDLPSDEIECTNCMDITWSSRSPSGTREWEWREVPSNFSDSRISMWYVPILDPQDPQDPEWYILTKEPLPTLPIDVRVATHSPSTILQSFD